MASAIDDVVNEVGRGQRVLLLDPLFFGQNIPGTAKYSRVAEFAQMLNGLGERPLGIEAGQLAAVVRWLGGDLEHGSPTPLSLATAPNTAISPVRIITAGPRSETIGLVAAAIHPELFSQLDAREAIPSFIYVFNHPQKYFGVYMNEAPELMCLDLYRNFDVNTLGGDREACQVRFVRYKTPGDCLALKSVEAPCTIFAHHFQHVHGLSEIIDK